MVRSKKRCVATGVDGDAVVEALDRLANVMRRYAEESVETKQLFAIDQEEAIDNLDGAFDAKLEKLHSLYDVMNVVMPGFRFRSHGDTALHIQIRNARHHNIRGLFKSWNRLMLKENELRQNLGAQYLLAGYRLLGGGAVVSEYYLKLTDVHGFYSLPYEENKLKPEQAKRQEQAVESGLSFGHIRANAENNGYPLKQVFFNVIPIFMAGFRRVLLFLKEQGVQPKGHDSETYWRHFLGEEHVDLSRVTFKSLQEPRF